jgi:hypothetical protein
MGRNDRASGLIYKSSLGKLSYKETGAELPNNMDYL